MSNPPKDGSIFYIRQLSIFPCKWTPYKPSSEQVRKHGIMGRWQQMNDFGGWENVTMDGGRHIEVKFDWRPSVDDFQTMQDTITELVGALEDAQKALAMVVDDDAIRKNNVAAAFAQCRASEQECRAALTKAKGSEK